MSTATLPIDRPVRVADDLSGTVIRDVDFTLYDLYAAEATKGFSRIEGKTITGCRIQGPAVMLVSGGVTFDAVNFGDSNGDIRNLLMRGEGTKAVGAIAVRDCAFVGCEFFGVGFTGPDDFLSQIRSLGTSPNART